MTTKKMIEHLKKRGTHYGWSLSWCCVQAIIKRLEEFEELKKACLNAQEEELKRMKRESRL